MLRTLEEQLAFARVARERRRALKLPGGFDNGPGSSKGLRATLGKRWNGLAPIFDTTS